MATGIYLVFDLRSYPGLAKAAPDPRPAYPTEDRAAPNRVPWACGIVQPVEQLGQALLALQGVEPTHAAVVVGQAQSLLDATDSVLGWLPHRASNLNESLP